METLEIIHKRASLKTRISSREVEKDKIVTILEAARAAPSARNKQPWRFVVVTDKNVIYNLANNAFMEVNHMVIDAPVLIFAYANPNDDITSNGQEYYLFDVALAMENLVLAATDLGLVTHLMTGVDGEVAKKILGIPQEMRFIVATPIAYPSIKNYDEAAEEKLSQRTRKELSEIVHAEQWGKSI